MSSKGKHFLQLGEHIGAEILRARRPPASSKEMRQAQHWVMLVVRSGAVLHAPKQSTPCQQLFCQICCEELCRSSSQFLTPQDGLPSSVACAWFQIDQPADCFRCAVALQQRFLRQRREGWKKDVVVSIGRNEFTTFNLAKRFGGPDQVICDPEFLKAVPEAFRSLAALLNVHEPDLHDRKERNRRLIDCFIAPALAELDFSAETPLETAKSVTS